MISREEAIKWLEKSAPVCVCTPNAFERFGFAINKAVSDMQKLEKVEKLLDIANNDTRLDNGWDYMFKIEQIVKEV